MITQAQASPLKHIRLSQGVLAAGVALLAVGLVMLFAMPQAYILAAVLAMVTGLGMIFAGGYYWGCANDACSY